MLERRKHTDADKVSDLNTCLDDLERELAKLALVGSGEGAGAQDAVASSQQQGAGGLTGRVAVRWAEVEDVEGALFKVKPEEIKVGSGCLHTRPMCFSWRVPVVEKWAVLVDRWKDNGCAAGSLGV